MLLFKHYANNKVYCCTRGVYVNFSVILDDLKKDPDFRFFRGKIDVTDEMAKRLLSHAHKKRIQKLSSNQTLVELMKL